MYEMCMSSCYVRAIVIRGERREGEAGENVHRSECRHIIIFRDRDRYLSRKRRDDFLRTINYYQTMQFLNFYDNQFVRRSEMTNIYHGDEYLSNILLRFIGSLEIKIETIKKLWKLYVIVYTDLND